MRGVRLTVGCAILLIGLLGSAVAGTGTSARAGATATASVAAAPDACRGSLSLAQRWRSDVTRVASERVLRFDGHEVSLTAQGWRDAYDASTIRSATWALWFRALVWTVPIAMKDQGLAVQLVLEQAREVPDPGPYASSETLVASGWTPGGIRNRLNTVRCLYQLTRDPRLQAVGRALGDSLMDPLRYSGWPRSQPHNHGALTSLALLRAAKTFHRPEWKTLTMTRLEKDLPRVFSACGMAREQSTGYQALNVSLWSDVADLLGLGLAGPSRALASLVRPDGALELIGDGAARTTQPNGQRLWCSRLGWAANTLPGRTHYVLRFGPQTNLHGHADHGAPTWFAQGIPVLSDRGLYDKKRDARLDYARGMSAHSVLEPVGVDLNPETTGKRIGPDAYRLTDNTDGIARERVVAIARRGLIATDIGQSWNTWQEWVQHWQLAPGWTPTREGARYKDGTRLRVTCEGGVLAAVAVESYPAWREIEPAWDLQCRATGATVRLRTTLELI